MSKRAEPVVADVGPYKILERIGRGGTGTVYRARHAHLQRDFAVKVLKSTGRVGSETLQRFQREMQALGKVRHPNIVQATDAGEFQGVYYIAMELLTGADVASLCEPGKLLPAAEACEIVRQAAIAIHHAHEKGVVHRDVKPSNLMLCRQGPDEEVLVKVLDLGLVRPVEDWEIDTELTPPGIVIGTFGYMAPEQQDDPRQVSRQSDVFSLGAVLSRLLTGHAIDYHPSRPDPSLFLESRLAAVLKRAVVADPARRYATAIELAQALQPVCESADLAKLLDRHMSHRKS